MSEFQASIASSIAFRCAGSSTAHMCEQGTIHDPLPPECISTIISTRGKSTVVKKSASTSSGGPSRRPGNERLKFAPDGQKRECACAASVEIVGTTMILPDTCAGSTSARSRRAAIWPSYSSPCVPPETSTVGPVAVRDRRDRDRDERAVAVPARQPELADLLAVGREVDRARDGMAHALSRDSRCRVTARLGRLEQAVDVLVGVGVREVAALQVQRQLEDAVLHQLAPVADEEVDVVPEQVVVARRPGPRGSSVTKTEPKPDTTAGTPMPVVERLQPRARALAEPEDVLVHGLALELLDRRERGRGRRGMAVERAGEERGLPGRGREEVHQLGLAAERRDGPAVRHRLAERRQVGRHAGDRLVAAEPVAEARDHLVEDEHGAVLRRELAQPLQEAGLRQHGADVVGDQLEDDRGDVVLVERALDLVGVVEAADDRRVDHLGQHPPRERILRAHALGGRDHVHRDRVVPAVVAALELDHVAAAGRGARDAQGVEGRLAAGAGEQHLLERRHVRRRAARRARPRPG